MRAAAYPTITTPSAFAASRRRPSEVARGRLVRRATVKVRRVVGREFPAACERFQIDILDHALRFDADRQGFEKIEIFLNLPLVNTPPLAVRNEDAVCNLKGPDLGNDGVILCKPAQDGLAIRSVFGRITGKTP